MPGYALNVEPLPSVNPIGAPGNDYEHIQATPEMFGAPIARATEKLGQGLEKASDVGFQVAQERQQIQDKTYAAQLHSWASDQWSTNSGQFLMLEGKAAVDALPGYKAKNQEILNSTVERAPDPYTKLLIQSESRRIMDSHNEMAERHAAGQQKVYQHNVASLNEASSGNQAVLFATNGDIPKAKQFLFDATQEARNQAELQGFQGAPVEQLAAAKRGQYVYQIVEGLARKDGPGYGPAVANEFYQSERDKIDAGSATKIEGFLKSDLTKIAAEKRADFIWNRSTDGLNSRAVAVRDDLAKSLGEKGVPLQVTSEYRSPEHNAAVGGARGSQHLEGKAFDASLRGLTPEQQQIVISQVLSDPRVGGFGFYPNSQSIHVDVRQGARAAWGTNYHSSSIGNGWPAWMTDQVRAWQAGATSSASASVSSAEGVPGAPTAPTGGKWTPVDFSSPESGGRAAPSLPGFPDVRVPSPSIVPTAVAPTWREKEAVSLAEADNDPELADRPQLKAEVMANIRRKAQLEELTTNQDARQKKDANDNAASDYVSTIAAGQHTPGFDWVKFQGQIARDGVAQGGRLNWETQQHLLDRVAKFSGEEERISYGTGFFDAKTRILSPPGTPGHIGSIEDILNLPAASITRAGEHELVNLFSLMKREDQAALQEAKHAVEMATKLRMVRPEDMGGYIKDVKGEQIFNGRFLPTFNSAYNEWVKSGKNPYDFLLDEKRIRQMEEAVYPKRDRDKDRLDAAGGVPPAPEGVNADAWKSVVTNRPTVNGNPIPQEKWSSALGKLLADPSPQTIAALDSHLGDTGFKAMDILRTLNPAAAIAAEKTGAIGVEEKPPGGAVSTEPSAAAPAETSREPAAAVLDWMGSTIKEEQKGGPAGAVHEFFRGQFNPTPDEELAHLATREEELKRSGLKGAFLQAQLKRISDRRAEIEAAKARQ